MEYWFEFLFHATIGTSLFFILYWLLLRKSTHFKANRYFLLGSVLLSILTAAFPVHYEVLLNTTNSFNLETLSNSFKTSTATGNSESTNDIRISGLLISSVIYVTGLLFFGFRLILQSWKPIHIIQKSKSEKNGNLMIHENDYYAIPFSFFNHILINPKYHKQEELDAILVHEQVHIHERHWIDLIFIELLTVILWFNPFIWLFELAIKQNHEYLADEGVLTRGHSPARYQALLVNQLMGMQVIGLTNNLNFALGPTRLKMMKKQKTPNKKLLQMAWGIPILAFMLFAFAKPDYKNPEPMAKQTQRSVSNPLPPGETFTIQGKVIDESGDELPGTTVLIKGSTKGTVVDRSGEFSLDIPAKEAELVFSFVGFKTVVIPVSSAKNKPIKLTMKRNIIGIDLKMLSSAKDVPPPPPVPESNDGDHKNNEVFIVVEDMPQYPNGSYGLSEYVKDKKKEIKATNFFQGKKLKGKATVGFTVDAKGNITNIHILQQTNEEAGKALSKIVSGMAPWKPGAQRGKNVSVDYALQLEF